MENKVKIRPLLKMMKVGNTLSFPINRIRTIRVTAYELSTTEGMKFTTRINRECQTVGVTRIK